MKTFGDLRSVLERQYKKEGDLHEAIEIYCEIGNKDYFPYLRNALESWPDECKHFYNLELKECLEFDKNIGMFFKAFTIDLGQVRYQYWKTLELPNLEYLSFYVRDYFARLPNVSRLTTNVKCVQVIASGSADISGGLSKILCPNYDGMIALPYLHWEPIEDKVKRTFPNANVFASRCYYHDYLKVRDSRNGN